MAEATLQQAFDQAVQHHEAGRLAQAEAIYQKVLAQNPHHADALHLLGVIATQTGRHDAAVDFIRRAISLKPNYPQAYNHLSIALKSQGKLDAADAACRQAIALKPNYAQAHNTLGNILKDKRQLDDAIAAFKEAIAIEPGSAEAYNNLGNVLSEKGQLEAAIEAYHKAINFKPDLAQAFINLGVALIDSGQLEAALTAFSRAVALQPNNPQAHTSLGNAQCKNGQPDAAIASYRQAIALNPYYAEAHSNLGNALHNKQQMEQAITSYRMAIALKHNFPDAHFNLGVVLADIGRRDEAIASYRQAIAIQPNYANAYNNLGNILKDKGELDASIAAYRQAIALNPNFPKADSNLIYTLLFHSDYDAQSIYQEHLRWQCRYAQPLERFIQPHANDPAPGRRLRVGYVSPDFRMHPVGRFLLPLFAHHNHRDFEIVAYSSVRRDDEVTERLRASVDSWHDIAALDDAQAADKIRAGGVDILVDLSLHMAENRMLLFARKPAPVQATWLGYAGTTGLATMDYRLSDPYLDPPGESEAFYVEKTLRLPDSFWCYEPPENSPPVSELPALAAGRVTFGCLNNFCKVTAPTLELWAALLRDMPGSQLVLHANPGSHQQEVRDRLATLGVQSSRIRFVGLQPINDYFAEYSRIDIALDPFPYGGGTTTCDGLWMGVPVVTLAGTMAVGRAGVSLLSNVDLTQWIARRPEEYLAIAREWVGDLPRLGRLRGELRGMMQKSVLMDATRFTAGMEAAYRQMWVEWCEGKKVGRREV